MPRTSRSRSRCASCCRRAPNGSARCRHGCAARSSAFCSAWCPGPAATLASFASYRLEKATSKYGARNRQRRHRRRRRPGSRQQFRRHRLAGAAARARHSLYADRGADDLGHAGAGHPARAAVDHPAPGNLLGPDRLGLYRQCHAAGAEYSDGRRLGQPAADSALSVHSAAAGAVRDRHLQRPQQHLRRLGAARRRRRSAISSTR